MTDTEDNQKLYDKLDMESEIVCPFCGEGEFDRIGLKYHFENSCDAYVETESVRLYWGKE